MTYSVKKYYNSVAKDYHEHYDEDDLMDLIKPYPANYWRLQLLKDRFSDRKNIVDVGCGDGTATKSLGIPVSGFDVAPGMVRKAGARFCVGDISSPASYEQIVRKYGPFDGLVCMGVMPHVEDEEQALRNMFDLVKGKVFIEFRNELFALFTLNRPTVGLIGKMCDDDWEWITKKRLSFLRTDLPKERPYDKMLAKFHNPMEIVQLFSKIGFHNIQTFYYHYHPAPPFMEEIDPELYRVSAMKHELQQDWRSMFVCSAFVVEASNE